MKRFISYALMMAISFSLMFVLTGCSTKSVYSYVGSENYLVGPVTLDSSEVQKLDIDWVSGSVTIEVVDGLETVVVEESSRYKILDGEALRYYLSSNGVLTIKFRESSKKLVNLTKEKNLNIKLPKGKSVKGDLVVNTVDSDIYVNRLEPERLYLGSVSGEITVINSKTTIAEVSSVSGDIKLKNSSLFELKTGSTSGAITTYELTSEKIKFENVSGDIDADISTTPITIDAETTSGDIFMKFENEKGFTADFSTVSGSFNCGFATQYQEGKYIYLDGIYGYNFITVDGNVSIEKR